MKIAKISQSQAPQTQLKRRNVNMSGFNSVASRQKSMINDKKANEAIKSNFLANVSFEGHARKFNVGRLDEYEWHERKTPIYAGTSGNMIIGYKEEKIKGRHLNTEYEVSSDNSNFVSRNLDLAVRKAITMSNDYEGGEIKQGRKFEVYEYSSQSRNSWNSKKAEVYFADRGEEIYKDNFKEYNYVVMPEGSWISEYDNHWEEQCDNDPTDYGPPGGFGWSWT